MFGRNRAAAPTEAEVLRLRAAAVAEPSDDTLRAFGAAAYLYELGTDGSCAKRAGEAAVTLWRERGDVPPLGFVDRLSY
jgi:hypothetical protein